MMCYNGGVNQHSNGGKVMSSWDFYETEVKKQYPNAECFKDEDLQEYVVWAPNYHGGHTGELIGFGRSVHSAWENAHQYLYP